MDFLHALSWRRRVPIQDGGVLTLCWMTDQSGFFLELLDTVVPELAVQETLPPE